MDRQLRANCTVGLNRMKKKQAINVRSYYNLEIHYILEKRKKHPCKHGSKCLSAILRERKFPSYCYISFISSVHNETRSLQAIDAKQSTKKKNPPSNPVKQSIMKENNQAMLVKQSPSIEIKSSTPMLETSSSIPMTPSSISTDKTPTASSVPMQDNTISLPILESSSSISTSISTTKPESSASVEQLTMENHSSTEANNNITEKSQSSVTDKQDTKGKTRSPNDVTENFGNTSLTSLPTEKPGPMDESIEVTVTETTIPSTVMSTTVPQSELAGESSSNSGQAELSKTLSESADLFNGTKKLADLQKSARDSSDEMLSHEKAQDFSSNVTAMEHEMKHVTQLGKKCLLKIK
jgi:hypothetical protein